MQDAARGLGRRLAITLLAGWFGTLADRAIMGVMTVLLCFPGIILAIALVSSLGPSVGNVTLAIGVIFVPAFSRIARANTLSLRSREFVLAAESLGAGLLRILGREILPNLVPALLSYAVVMLGVAILAEAALGFLGLSVPPPQPSWGGIIATERANLVEAPHTVFVPAAVLFLTVLSINWIGEAIRRLFDIRAQSL
jgi:peptide/nickel transport system permease protein